MTTPGENRVGSEDWQHAPPGTQAAVGSRGRRRRRRGDPNAVVPDAVFTSYYGRPVVKPSPWTADIPAYLFFGGLAAGSSLLAEGAAVRHLPALARHGRITALVGVATSGALLVHDLGRPERFLNMLRVAKPTSPMSVGTWLLSAFGPPAALAAVGELVTVAGWTWTPVRLVAALTRPASVAAALVAPGIATYTAVLLTDTATPAWNDARRELPFVFAASAAAASAGLALVTVPTAQAGPARRLAVAGAVVELAAQHRMERSMGLSAETLKQGVAGRWHRLARAATPLGAALVAAAELVPRRSARLVAALGGAALVTGSLATRFAVFEAGQASAKDPRYTVVPQRERLDRQEG